MSILYQALKKAEGDIKEKMSERKRPERKQEVLTTFKRLEEQQQNAVNERLRTRNAQVGMKTAIWKTIAIMMILFVCSAAVAYYVLVHQGSLFKSDVDQVQVIAPPVLDFQPAVEQQQPMVEETPAEPVPEAKPIRDVVVEKVEPQKRNISVTPAYGGLNTFGFNPATGRPLFVCSGIIMDPTGNYCFLNGIIMRAGEVLNGARILSIEDKIVMIEYEDEMVTLRMPRSN
ncbi:hypothetical protein ACFL3D_01765 [Candidatus Omnitrophota bacterium]